jgi:hypothetical protein
MISIMCSNCGKENVEENKNNIITECAFCFATLNQLPTGINENKQVVKIKNLTLIYQITQDKIEININEKVILGRENHGRELFEKIRINGKVTISRKHCSIEYKDGKFYLFDDSSLNGTFLGINKIDCKKNEQVIENHDFVYLGEEPFMALINFEDPEQLEKEKTDSEENSRIVKQYQCNDQNCGGYKSEKPFELCPVCGTFNNVIFIY